MSLAREACVWVAAAYRLGLALEDLRAASNPSADPGALKTSLARVHERIDALDALPWTARGIDGLLLGQLEVARARGGGGPMSFEITAESCERSVDEILPGIQRHVAARVGGRLRDQLDAILVLLLIEKRERGSKALRRPADLAPWIGVDASEITEMFGARAMAGMLRGGPHPDSVRLTVDGQLFAESLLEGGEEPAQAPAIQTSPDRAHASPARIEGIIERLEVQNLLSFGNGAEPIELGRLNVLIGANGAGKSNVLELIELLAATPRDLQAAVRDAGGIHDLLSRASKPEESEGSVEVVIRLAHHAAPLRHRLGIAAEEQRFVVVDELIEDVGARRDPSSFPLFERGPSGPTIAAWDTAQRRRGLARVSLSPTRSILSERRDPERYPELADLASFYEGLRSYREPLLGRLAAPRAPQATDLPNDQLLADGSNLALVLGRLRLDPPTRAAIVDRLRDVYASVRDIETKTEGGTIQIFLQDEGFPLSARRISDGTMRLLCLLVVLCDPKPPPVVLIEEPELGLHPDAIGVLADVLRDAAERTQVIVTTHSEALVDRFGDTPEAIVVVDKEAGSTCARRLDAEQLREWLDKYSLGRLWRMGELGGNRW